MPLDINTIRSNPQAVIESQIKRFKDPELVTQVLELDRTWRELTGQIDQLNKQKNIKQKEIAGYYKSKQDKCVEAQVLSEQIVQLTQQIAEAQSTKCNLELSISKLIGQIGNVIAPDVPVSKDEVADMCVISSFGTPPIFATNPLNHHVLLERIGGFDPERGVKVAGHKGYFLKGPGIRLNQALINYSLDFLDKRGCTLLQPPYFIKQDIIQGVAQLEDFDESLYKIETGSEPLYMIATSEQPICGYHANEWIGTSELPKRYGGLSTCFRKESGSHGKDTWGIFRVHQFDKIEQFAITEDSIEASDCMQKEMIGIAEEFYQSLEIPYRVVNIVSGELNNAAIRKYDLEGWFPGYSNYRELVSCSNCTDYQSRPMGIKCGDKRYVHMLNATLCACTRVICCLLELGQREDGIELPEVLGKYMGGSTFIPWAK